MKINEYRNNVNLIVAIKPSFYYYDDRWNFPYGENIGYMLIEYKLGQPVDNETKRLIPIFEKYLNDNNIPEDVSLNEFEEIWNKVKKLSE